MSLPVFRPQIRPTSIIRDRVLHVPQVHSLRQRHHGVPLFRFGMFNSAREQGQTTRVRITRVARPNCSHLVARAGRVQRVNAFE